MSSPFSKYKLTVAYDGTRYSGWQIQPNAPTVQAFLQQSLTVLLKSKTAVIGAGRTDAGVHALAQVAHFKTAHQINPLSIRASLNGMLPYDIRVKEIEPTSQDFHAQHHALMKTYHYHLHSGPVDDPFRRPYHYAIKFPIDLTLLEKGASCFVGTHDFTSFANESGTGAAAKNPIRTLKRLDMIVEEEALRLEFEGNGFLYKMVRNIVGMLLEVSSGKRPIEEIAKVFAAKDRRLAAMAAPPQGLFLVKVDYPRFDLKQENVLHQFAQTLPSQGRECY